MSPWRPFLAILSALTLFHLTIWSGGSACVMPQDGGVVAGAHGVLPPTAHHESAPSDGGHQHHAAASSDDVPPPTHPDGSHDTRPCASAVPCTVAVAAGSHAPIAAAPGDAAMRLDWGARALPSIAVAPELPPPRAA